jgi:N-acetylated-alpha-linked acidic dipeptidase
MRRRLAALLGTCALLLSSSPVRAGQLSLREQYLLDVPTASAELHDSAQIDAESHYASTPGDYHIAVWMRDQLAAAGFTATLEPFSHDVPFSTHLSLELMTKPKPTTFALDEGPVPGDPEGARKSAGPPFNAWSGSGVVLANVVDAGHGMPSDYRALTKRGVDVRTRILLIRYGREFRGELAKRAQDRGARGVIFFSDPADRDGSLRGPAYPDGPYRPLDTIQRGALTEHQITIPTLPVTALVAQRLLATIHNGISDVPVRLDVQMSLKRNATLWNTVGVLRGQDPSHEIVLGAHRDAWVYGVTDNGSGISILLDAARALGYLYRSGWRPRFSIMIVGFDGEELGELGSKAYVQAHRGALESGCIAYINEDEATTGTHFGANAAAALQGDVLAATDVVPDPTQPSLPLFRRWQDQRGGAHVRGPGGGSDFEPFLYDLGIPTIEMGFYGIFGVYHSAYDDLMYATTQADPGFINHHTLAQLVALLAMRLSSGHISYRLVPYAERMLSAAASLAPRHPGDLAPVRDAIARFAGRAALADRRGMNGNTEMWVVHQLDRLFYGRNGYAPIRFPALSAALASDNRAAISAAAGATARQLDAITAAIVPR